MPDAPERAQKHIMAMEALVKLFGHSNIILITSTPDGKGDSDIQLLSGMSTEATIDTLATFLEPNLPLEMPDGTVVQ